MDKLKKYLQDEYQMQDHREIEEFTLEVLKTLKIKLTKKVSAPSDKNLRTDAIAMKGCKVTIATRTN
jgi:hypothetical protein